jgi:hypothetical protein
MVISADFVKKSCFCQKKYCFIAILLAKIARLTRA